MPGAGNPRQEFQIDARSCKSLPGAPDPMLEALNPRLEPQIPYKSTPGQVGLKNVIWKPSRHGLDPLWEALFILGFP